MYKLQLDIQRTKAAMNCLCNDFQKGELFERILNYAEDGTDEPSDDEDVEKMFSIIKLDIDANKAKYLARKANQNVQQIK